MTRLTSLASLAACALLAGCVTPETTARTCAGVAVGQPLIVLEGAPEANFVGAQPRALASQQHGGQQRDGQEKATPHMDGLEQRAPTDGCLELTDVQDRGGRQQHEREGRDRPVHDPGEHIEAIDHVGSCLPPLLRPVHASVS